MTDESSKRKRRRWITAGVLLFGIAVTGWWCWPRVDQRFVGKWTMSVPGVTQPLPAFEFRADGVVTITPPTGQPFQETWHTAAGWLFVEEPASGFASLPIRFALRLAVMISGSNLGWRADAYRIINVRPDSIEIQMQGGTGTFHRIPE